MAARGLVTVPSRGAPLAEFAERVALFARICPPGHRISMELTVEDAAAFAGVLARAAEVERQGVVAVGVVEVDRPMSLFQQALLTFVMGLALFGQLTALASALVSWIAGAFA